MATKTRVKLPSPQRLCEGCRNFIGLTYNGTVVCRVLGKIDRGMVICMMRREETDEEMAAKTEGHTEGDA